MEIEILRGRDSYFWDSPEHADKTMSVSTEDKKPEEGNISGRFDKIFKELEEFEKKLKEPLFPSLESTPKAEAVREEEVVPWTLKKFHDVYASPKDKPVLLKVEHAEKIDEIRRMYNEKRTHGGQDRLTTSDVVNAALDFLFSREGIPFQRFDARGSLARLISDYLYHSAISHWRQFNEKF